MQPILPACSMTKMRRFGLRSQLLSTSGVLFAQRHKSQHRANLASTRCLRVLVSGSDAQANPDAQSDRCVRGIYAPKLTSTRPIGP